MLRQLDAEPTVRRMALRPRRLLSMLDLQGLGATFRSPDDLGDLGYVRHDASSQRRIERYDEVRSGRAMFKTFPIGTGPKYLES